MKKSLKISNGVTLLILLSTYPVLLYGQVSDQSEKDKEESEFAEPIFFDTSTDIGGEAKELEINYVPSFDIDKGISYLSSSFEFEYVIVKNFGIELEPGFTTFFTGDSIKTGLNDWELELQYTFIANDKLGIAGGIEFGIPIGNRAMGLSEGTFEIEPFITTVYKTNFGLSFHPRFSLGLSILELDEPLADEPEEIKGMEYVGSLAVLFSHKNLFIGTELSGIYDEEMTTIITPQIGLTINNFFLGTGFQFFISNELTSYGVISRLIYELEFDR